MFSLLAIWIKFTRSLAYWQKGGRGDRSLSKIVSYRNSNQSRTIVIHRDRAFQSHIEINDTFLPLLLKYFLFYPVLVVFSCCVHVVFPAVATKRPSIAFPCLFFVLFPLRSIEQFHSLSNFFCLAMLFPSRYLSFLVRSTIPQKRLALVKNLPCRSTRPLKVGRSNTNRSSTSKFLSHTMVQIQESIKTNFRGRNSVRAEAIV